MSNYDNLYCVILAGGKGRRLWPCSREHYPKQFIDFFGVGRTQLQQAYDRFSKIIPRDHILINTNLAYVDIVKEQLPDLADENLLAEPIYRNTAPSVAWAAFRIKHRDPDACLLVCPSDLSVLQEDVFAKSVEEGYRFVRENDYLLTLGVRPTRPEPGYGYIQLGEQLQQDTYQVKTFTEKPQREFAKMFMDSGEFLWNTGIFVANVRFLLSQFDSLLPVVLRRFEAMGSDFTLEEENAFVKENFPLYPNMSVDYSILEKTQKVAVMQCYFGWADLGTWHSIYEAMQRSDDDNVVVDSNVLLDSSHNNIIKLPKDRLAVIHGLDGYIVAEKDNVLFICRKEDSSALVRKFVNEVRLNKGDEYV